MKQLKEIRISIIGQWLYNVPKFSELLRIFGRKILYCFLPYLKYKKEKKENTFWNYSYHNFWNWIKKWEFRVERFIEKKWLNKTWKKIDFFSNFWPKKNLKYSNNVKIFYTWEYIWKDRFPSYDDYCLWKVDLSLWFRNYTRNDYCHLPWRLCTLIDPCKTSYKEIWEQINKIELIKFSKKNKFCCLISRHDDKLLKRTKIYNELTTIDNIDCPANLLHNIDVKIPTYADKISFLKDYKFNICPENKNHKWYITEKLVDSLKGWCIPIFDWIFWDIEEKVFNKKRIIRYGNTLKENVDILYKDTDAYKNFIEIPIFNKWAQDIIYEMISNFNKKINSII